jgi:hypothetical protein
MNYRSTIFRITGLAALLVSACSLYAQHHMVYTNEKDGYAIEYPETWQRLDEFESQLSMVALAPEESEAEDGVRESFNIALYTDETNVPGAFFAQYKTSHQEKHRSWKAISEGELMARESTTTFFSCYYADLKTKRTHGELVYVFKQGEKVVVLTCTTSFDEFDRYKTLFDQIARSFSFDARPAE